MTHIPVLQNEVIEYLDPKPNENFIDCTFGQGGHSKLILERTKPKGKILGIEVDSDLFKKAKELGKTKGLILVNDSYTNLEEITKKYNFDNINGILLIKSAINYSLMR